MNLEFTAHGINKMINDIKEQLPDNYTLTEANFKEQRHLIKLVKKVIAKESKTSDITTGTGFISVLLELLGVDDDIEKSLLGIIENHYLYDNSKVNDELFEKYPEQRQYYERLKLYTLINNTKDFFLEIITLMSPTLKKDK